QLAWNLHSDRRGPTVGALQSEVTVEGGQPSLSACYTTIRMDGGAAPAIVLNDDAKQVIVVADPHPHLARTAVPCRVGQGLGHGEVRRGRCRPRGGAVQVARDVNGNR